MNRETFEPGPLAEVSGEVRDDRWTLRFVRDLRHPVEQVWAALTDPAQLAEWAPFVADRDLAATGGATLTMIDGEERVETAGSVLRVEPPTLLEYRWADDLLRWELEPIPGGTRLTLRHTVGDRDGLSRAAAGWHLCLVVASQLLDGEPIGPIRGGEAMQFGWGALDEAYARQLDRA